MDDEEKQLKYTEIALKYAWDWFSYHAGQRLRAFHFFLIIIGVVVVGYLKCVDEKWQGFGFLIGLFGFFISIAFWILEIRNEELVNCARGALMKLEEQVGLTTIRKDDDARKHLKKSLDWFSWLLSRLIPARWRFKIGGTIVKHRFWLRLIYLVTGIAFALAAIYARQGFR